MLKRKYKYACRESVKKVLGDEFELIKGPNEHNGNSPKAYFTNGNLGLKFELEVRENFVFLFIAKITDGNFPMFPRPVLPDSKIEEFDITDLLTIRAPKAILLPGSNFRCLEFLLERHCENICLYCQDLMKGDFSVFIELENIVKNRACFYGIKQYGVEYVRQQKWDPTLVKKCLNDLKEMDDQ